MHLSRARPVSYTHLDVYKRQGFTYCVPPFMIRSNVVTGVMSFAEMEAMMYKIEGEDLYLIGTSEHSMIGKFIDQIIPEPVSYTHLIGLGSGWIFSKYFERAHIRDTIKILLILSWSFILVTIEDSLNTPVTFSALIAIMFMGVGLQKYRREVSIRLAVKYNKLWVGAEVFLFVLVGAAVNINYLGNVGIKAIIVIAGALIFRMLGVLVCLLKSNLNIRERAFSMIAYTPKATVQAAIGGIPLSPVSYTHLV